MTTLCLLRHGRATGQDPLASLTPEGEARVTELGRALAAEGWTVAAAYTSPYTRARHTAALVLGAAALSADPVALSELTPDRDPAEALAALRAHGLPEGRVLVVAHMPLLARLALRLTGDPIGFSTGMLAEIELPPGGGAGRLVRVLGDAG